MIERELLDTDGENRAVRAFLMLYGQQGVTAKSMQAHMEAMGYPYAPDWVDRSPGHLTKGGAQLWLRMLFDLEGARLRALEVITECRDALAEELGAWDIDPPLHHVKQAHDRCEAWLAEQSKQRPMPEQPCYVGVGTDRPPESHATHSSPAVLLGSR